MGEKDRRLRLVPPSSGSDDTLSQDGPFREAWVDRLGAGEIGRPASNAALLRELDAFARNGLHVVEDSWNGKGQGIDLIVIHPIDPLVDSN